MQAVYRIGVVGDHREGNPTHQATNDALDDASVVLGHECQVTWLGTAGLERHGVDVLARFDVLVLASGSPYESTRGALDAIEWARTNDVPLLGTCGGFQHIVIEFARNVAGIEDAAHAELPGWRFFVGTLFVPQMASEPGAPHPLVRAFAHAAAGG